jgi:hypothetical protein
MLINQTEEYINNLINSKNKIHFSESFCKSYFNYKKSIQEISDLKHGDILYCFRNYYIVSKQLNQNSAEKIKNGRN